MSILGSLCHDVVIPICRDALETIFQAVEHEAPPPMGSAGLPVGAEEGGAEEVLQLFFAANDAPLRGHVRRDLVKDVFAHVWPSGTDSMN